MAIPIREGLPKHLAVIWVEVEGGLRGAIGSAGMEAFCCQVHRAREAQARITEEGMVVQDSKGNPVPHPALAIERQAQAEIRAWLGKFSRPG